MSDPVCLAFLALLLAASNLFAATHYVSTGSKHPKPPYATWRKAATNIQAAVDSAAEGDEVVVAAGIYGSGGRALGTSALVNRVLVDKQVTLSSVDGPQFTVIDGGGMARCVYLANGATLVGFTLTNGVTLSPIHRSPEETCGGGILCESAAATASNCVISGNRTFRSGGGAYGGTIKHCVLQNNQAIFEAGGGAFNAILYNCTLNGNVAGDGGGASQSVLQNCALADNRAADEAGGGAHYCTLDNCTLTANHAKHGGAAFYSTLGNCTLLGNSGVYGSGAARSTLNNCVVYFNIAPDGANYDATSTLNYCCTMPLPTNGVGNITDAPRLVDTNGWSNLHLQSDSPCINAGNNAYVRNSADFEGNPRIVSGTVDIGAFEFQGTGSWISYAWLQRYGWPTDGSADALDPDHDGMNNWQEWRCLTDPTNALSVLKLLAPAQAPSGLTVSWQSVPERNYWLEVATNLASPAAFCPVATNLAGRVGTTSYTDTNATGPGPFFYRVGVGD